MTSADPHHHDAPPPRQRSSAAPRGLTVASALVSAVLCAALVLTGAAAPATAAPEVPAHLAAPAASVAPAISATTTATTTNTSAIALTPELAIPALTPSPDEAGKDYFAGYNDSCFQQKGVEDSAAKYCKYGDRKGDIRIAVIGDSKTKQYVPAMDYAGDTRGWAVDVYAKTACPFAKYNAGDRGKTYPACTTWNRNVLERVRSKGYDYVVTALNYQMVRSNSTYNSWEKRNARFIQGLRSHISAVQKSGAKVILINSTPRSPRDVPACLQQNAGNPKACNIPRSYALSSRQVWSASARKSLMSGLVPSSRLISLNGGLCGDSSCRAVAGSTIVFRDSHHLTNSYVLNRQGFIARALERIIG